MSELPLDVYETSRSDAPDVLDPGFDDVDRLTAELDQESGYALVDEGATVVGDADDGVLGAIDDEPAPGSLIDDQQPEIPGEQILPRANTSDTFGDLAMEEIPEPPEDSSIQDAADARGISLNPDRASRLSEVATIIREVNGTPDSTFRMGYNDLENDLRIGPTKHTERFGTTAASVDFTPTVERDDNIVSGPTYAQPEHATQFSLMWLHGVQNYALLVDTGALEKPDVLYGETNAEMAIVAERFGVFSDIARRYPDDPRTAHREMREQPKLDIYGSYDDLCKRVFSDDARELEAILNQRLTGQR